MQLIVLLLLVTVMSQALSVTTIRNAKLKQAPTGRARTIASFRSAVVFKLLISHDSLGYSKVQSQEGDIGWIYGRLVQRTDSDPVWWVPQGAMNNLEICSFNINWLGHYEDKRNDALVNLVRSSDIVVVQELVTPPFDGRYCGGAPYNANPKARAFVDLMTGGGYRHYLSCEDTGKTNQAGNSSSTEWFVVFYRPEKVRIDSMRTEWLGTPRAAHPVYERVPYRFQFKTVDNTLDFSLISVHLASPTDAKAHRKREAQAIIDYVEANNSGEKDFFILGDMNFQKKGEMESAIPEGWKSLNEACAFTNVAGVRSASSAKPYDHVFYQPIHSEGDFSPAHPFRIQNIYDVFFAQWAQENPDKASGSQWANNFSIPFSDHFPMFFTLRYGGSDDD